MKIATETKEDEFTIDGSEAKSVLKLVPNRGRDTRSRVFRIGVSADVFERRETSREKPLQTSGIKIGEATEEDPGSEKGVTKLGTRIDALIILGVAGLALGFLIGRHSRR